MNTQVVLFLGSELKIPYSECIRHSELYNARYDGLRYFHLTRVEDGVFFEGTSFRSSLDKPLSKIFDLIYQDINKITVIKKNEDNHINFSIITSPITNNDNLIFLKEVVVGLEELYVLKGYMMRITLVVPTLNIIDQDIEATDFNTSQLIAAESNVFDKIKKGYNTLEQRFMSNFNSLESNKYKNDKGVEIQLDLNAAFKAREIQMLGIKSIEDVMSSFSINHKIIILDNQNLKGKGLNLNREDFGILVAYFVELLYHRQNEILNSWTANYMSFGLSSIYYDFPQIMNLLEHEFIIQENVKNKYCSDDINYEMVLPAIDSVHILMVEYLEKLNRELPKEDQKLICEDIVQRLLNELKQTDHSHFFSFLDDPNFSLTEKNNIIALWGNLRSPEPGYSKYSSLLSLLYPIVSKAYKSFSSTITVDDNEEDLINTKSELLTSIYEDIDMFIASLKDGIADNVEIPSFEDILLRNPEALNEWSSIVNEVSNINFDKYVISDLDKNISQLTEYYTKLSKRIDSKFNTTWFAWLKRFLKKEEYSYNLDYLKKINSEIANLSEQKVQVFKIKYQLDFIEKVRSQIIDKNNLLTNLRSRLKDEKVASQLEIDTILKANQNPLFISLVPIKDAYEIIKKVVSNSLNMDPIFASNFLSDITLFENKRSAYLKSIFKKDIVNTELKEINVSASILHFLLSKTSSSEDDGVYQRPIMNPGWLIEYLSETQDYSIELMFKENISPFVYMNQLDKSEFLQKTYGLFLGNIETLSMRLGVKKSLDKLVNTNSELYEFNDPYKVVAFSFGKINNLEDCAF